MLSMSNTLSAGELDSVVESYKSFNLDGRRSELDERALLIASAQESSVRNRKKLSESVKSFKQQLKEQAASSSTESGTNTNVSTLKMMKAFQMEIDELTKRAKSAESSFMSVYQHLFELPDIVPYLDSCRSSVLKLESVERSHATVVAELEEYKEESTKIRNQTLTVRKLREQIDRMENEIADKDMTIDDLKKKIERDTAINSFDNEKSMLDIDRKDSGNEIKSNMDNQGDKNVENDGDGDVRKKEANSSVGLNDLTQQLTETQQELQSLRREYYNVDSKLLSVLAEREEETAARQGELEIIVNDNERRESALKLECEALRAKITKLEESKDSLLEEASSHHDHDASTSPSNDQIDRIKELEELLSAKESGMSAIRSENSQLRADIVELKSNVEVIEDNKLKLEIELKSRPLASEVSRLQEQVRALQTVKMNEYNEDLDTRDSEANEFSVEDMVLDENPSEGGIQLERLLLGKNRKLESEIISVRNQYEESRLGLLNTEKHVKSLELIVAEQRRLISQLEEEAVIKLDNVDTNLRPADAEDVEGDVSTNIKYENANQTILKALADQRDRARERLQQSEEILVKEKQELEKSKEEIKSLKDDNVKLYEKLKYVQQYNSSSKAIVEKNKSGNLESRYQQMYDEQVTKESTPFEEFKGRERIVRQSKSLHYHDKIALSGVRLLLSNRFTRAGLMLYLCILHFLVMASLARKHNACHTSIQMQSGNAAGGGIHLFP